jgi:hypothetical protein
MATNVGKSHAMGFNAILGSTITGLLLIASIATTVNGITDAFAVVLTTILFAGFVSTIFLSHTVRDWLNSHSLAARFVNHSEQHNGLSKAE